MSLKSVFSGLSIKTVVAVTVIIMADRYLDASGKMLTAVNLPPKR